VLKYHHLFDSQDIEDVSMQVGDGHAKEWANLQFPKTEEDQLCAKRLATLSFLLAILTPLALKEIKMAELYTKFCPFLKSQSTWTTRIVLIQAMR
jgi:hypothetical protein